MTQMPMLTITCAMDNTPKCVCCGVPVIRKSMVQAGSDVADAVEDQNGNESG